MRGLLDTHTLLWWVVDDPRLSPRVRDLLADRRNEMVVSAASAWEIGLKSAKGKLRLPPGAEDRIMGEIDAAGFQQLAVSVVHAFAVRRLPAIHLDPFDRLLIVQSQLEGLTLITNDRVMRRYAADCLW